MVPGKEITEVSQYNRKCHIVKIMKKKLFQKKSKKLENKVVIKENSK